MARLVDTPVDCTVPWTPRVLRVLDATPPDGCVPPSVCASMSAKLVSVVLNPAVWVLAMFPEMLFNARDCAEAPEIEFESAAKRPIGVSIRRSGTAPDPTRHPSGGMVNRRYVAERCCRAARRPQSSPDDAEHDLPAMRAVAVLDQVDSLPRAQGQSSVDQRDAQGGIGHHRADMGRHVV